MVPANLARAGSAYNREQRGPCTRFRRERIHAALSGYETDANHFREEGRHCHLDRCGGRLYDWRNDLRPDHATVT
jgi:hypothetical protein